AVVVLDADDAANAFDQLSGEMHSSTHSALHGATGFAANVPLNHLRTNLNAPLQPGAPIAQAGDAPIPASALPQPATLPLWVEAVGNWQHLDGDSNAASVDHDTGGLFVGGDHRLANGWHLGGAFGYTDSRIRVSDRRSKADADSYSLALYGGKAFQQQNGTLNVMFGGAYTWHSVDAKRAVTIGGATQHLSADYDAHTTQFFGEVGYAFPVTRNTTLEPFAGLAWRELRSESFREKGGSAALQASTNSNDVTTTTLGLRTKTAIKLNGHDASLNATLGWRHAEGDVTPTSRFAFQGGESFTVAGAPIARDAALVEVGASMMLSRNASLGISYAGQYGEGNRDHTGRISLRWRF
ncbi:MAG TPA: autotransporter outer membrane beta-barrel domain-containing protein, partial [Burkholderiales bacterium]|nr:autotransporter outer membrane beta-barrel domain-containing protein [Burkholderiales bacterium]